eukprot:scaffold558079_cov15-Prasinocladus_malaysianus.AAC.1
MGHVNAGTFNDGTQASFTFRQLISMLGCQNCIAAKQLQPPGTYLAHTVDSGQFILQIEE